MKLKFIGTVVTFLALIINGCSQSGASSPASASAPSMPPSNVVPARSAVPQAATPNAPPAEGSVLQGAGGPAGGHGSSASDGPSATLAADSQPQNAGSSTASGSDAIDSERFAAGRKVFALNCAKCHAAGLSPTRGGPAGQGPGGPPLARGTGSPSGKPGGSPSNAMPGPMGGMGRGPALTNIGTKRTRDWIIQHVRNPKTHNPQSRMRAFDGVLNEHDLEALADYLVSLK